MAKNRNTDEIKLIESGWGVLAGFNHLLVTLAAKMGLPSGTLYRLGTPEGQETLMAATKAFLAEVAKTVVQIWRTVVSGPTHDQLVAGAEAKGRTISDWARQLIAKVTTTAGVTYRLVVILGDEFATDEERTFSNIRAVAKTRGYRVPPPEVALLLAQYTQQELGFQWLGVMHDPISASGGYPGVLVVRRYDDGGEGVNAWRTRPTRPFFRGCAFVFLAPQGVVA
jgi:hypothetical protein